ncbi:succinate dehydrogenase cytochrome b subunit [Aurantibacillus circumpalustris]|uniref:succinate dehydrogenase cytochrome b subunit n=1 Tax=Aurantibacillus circumpalustris TaxID=3036359 RepID=UPI00295B8360|nr:succinate dehydrogenase cytochrome b subunit [Aurantibacillus circumpalustris]
MSKKSGFLSSSIGKKVIMGATGLFLISFLVIHCFLNSLIFVNDSGALFNEGAHFMATNWIIRAMEVVLMLGIILHIVQALVLTLENKKARPIGYAKVNGSANSSWYSRSMGLLGTLLLIFLIIHLAHFWVKSRFTGLPIDDNTGHDNLYIVMQETFKYAWVVAVYCLAMISLAYHLMHGFQSAFQTLGLNHKKYTPLIKSVGMWFSIIIPIIFAAMPITMHFGLIK